MGTKPPTLRQEDDAEHTDAIWELENEQGTYLSLNEPIILYN